MVGLLALAAPAQAAFPGQKGKIAYVQLANGESTGHIRSYPDGGAPAGPGDYNADPAWSPDGQFLAFARDMSFGDQSFDIFIPGCCGDEDFGLADGREPAWSPDGLKIAFVTPGGNIASMNADGSGLVTLTSTGVDNYPAWSPDGTTIAFTSGRDGVNKTYAMNADGSAETLLGPGVPGVQPNWSPNGRMIAFSSGNEIAVMDADGTEVRVLTSNEVADRDPAWSPDGQLIAFEHGDFAPQIWSMSQTGTGQTLLFSGTDPDWQPIPVGYARPRGATPIHVSLVPAYRPCTAANRTHGPPLGFPSCASPAQESNVLTVGTPDANARPAKSTGYVRYDVLVGDPATSADEADVRLETAVGDVRRTLNLADYAGALQVRFAMRVTDRNNTPSPGGPGPGTMSDTSFFFNVPCAVTADATVGSTCSANTTADAVVPGAVKEGVRSMWQLDAIEVWDGGAGGNPDESGNALFLTQGLFVPLTYNRM